MKSVIDIDVLGSYNTVKATMPHLVESAKKHRTDGKTQPANGTGGRIIFVSATLHYAGTPLQSHVSVAKAGVDAMAMAIAIEKGPVGITSNVIAPGPIADTEGIDRLSKKENRERSYKAVPAGRYGTVKEIADATIYLFSDSGNYVNGETLVGELFQLGPVGCAMRLLTLVQSMAVHGIRKASAMASNIQTSFCQEIQSPVSQEARSRSCRTTIVHCFFSRNIYLVWCERDVPRALRIS
ncbi:MAG: SDR family oxidoreductase [Cytophagaceae bacterium]|nr:MAG: SDR family oxidoreductase [Cytophagaceae bacterium]